MKKLKLNTIISLILCSTCYAQIYGMKEDNGYLNALSEAFVRLDKTFGRGHAPIFEEQLRTNTLSQDVTTNTHELDWSLQQIIKQKNSAPLVQTDRVVNMLDQVKTQMQNTQKNKKPAIIQVSQIARDSSLEYLQKYQRALQEESAKVAALQAFLNGRNSVSSSNMNNQSPIIDEDNDVDDDYIELDTDSETPVISTTFINPTPIDMSPNAVTLAKAAAAAKTAEMNTANSNNNVNSNNSKKNKKNQNQKPNNDQL